MPRIRSLKPELFASPQVMNLELGARLLFIGLITQADDEGRGSADERKLRATILPGDDLSPTTISNWLECLAKERLIKLYEVSGHGKLYALPTWKRHQKIDRPRSSSYPAPDESSNSGRALTASLTTIRRSVDESSAMPRQGSDRKDRKDQNGSRNMRAGIKGPAQRESEAEQWNRREADAETIGFRKRNPGETLQAYSAELILAKARCHSTTPS